MSIKILKNAALVGLLVSLFVSVSCSSVSHGESFTSALDSVDSYIAMGNTADAVKELKSLEKKAYSSYERLGIYKRYEVIGEKVKAEDVLLKGLKKLPDNSELCAVYSVFLMRNDRVEEAYPYTLNLIDTRYASINSECMLRLAMEKPYNAEVLFSGKGFSKKTRKQAAKAFKKSQKQDLKTARKTEKIIKKNEKAGKRTKKAELPQASVKLSSVFYDPRFIPVYENAFKGSKNREWLYNAAVIWMKNGMFEKACEIFPGNIESLKDGEFWGQIFYDCANYEKSLECLLSGEKLWKGELELFDLLALESDNYYVLNDDEQAFTVRNEILEKWKELSAENTKKIHESNLKKAVETSYLNQAAYYQAKENDRERYNNLYSLVNEFPLCEDGLSAYGSYAIELSRRPAEDELLQLLRQKNIMTLEMLKAESDPFIEVSDALQRENNALEMEKSPRLVVSRELLIDELNRDEYAGKANSRVWTVIERNADSYGYIDGEIVHYAVSKLLQNKDYTSAKRVFNRYQEEVHEVRLWELEVKAWFAAMDGDINSAVNLYTEIIEKYSNRSPTVDSEGKNAALINAYVNLAVIYSGTERIEKALDMLNKASARSNNAVVKAEILYRIAGINYSQGDSKSALRSVQYAISMDENNRKARLLLNRIRNENKK